jgi:hypothetical protein
LGLKFSYDKKPNFGLKKKIRDKIIIGFAKVKKKFESNQQSLYTFLLNAIWRFILNNKQADNHFFYNQCVIRQ